MFLLNPNAKKTFFFTVLLFCFLFFNFFSIKNNSSAEESLSKKLSGRILLQVENNGEAWYVNPGSLERYYLGGPSEAFNIMKSLSIGITNQDLSKIPIGLLEINEKDSDQDGLSDSFERAVGTDINSKDSDNDGYEDKAEILNLYDPLGAGKIDAKNPITMNNLGKIFLQVENNEEAWYLDPVTKKRYYLEKPENAFKVMRSFGLGITNNDLNQIPFFTKKNISPIKTNANTCDNCDKKNETEIIMSLAAQSIKNNNENDLNKYFTPAAEAMAKYSMNFLDNQGRENLANLMSNAQLTNRKKNEEIYTSYISFQGSAEPVKFSVKKQDDGTWKLSNI